MRTDSDQGYVDRVLQGEVNAFTPLVHRHQDLVFSICLRILNSREEAEEAAQDAFLNAYRALEKFRGQASFGTWLYRIAYNTAVSRTRKKRVEWTGLDEEAMERLSDILPDEEEVGDWIIEQGERLGMAVRELPSQDQLLLELFYTRNLGMESIAEITGLSLSNVKVKIHRVRKRLLTQLQESPAVPEIERGNIL
jgi:RNA polymerase sigma-70 factor (ECF subfamily)